MIGRLICVGLVLAAQFFMCAVAQSRQVSGVVVEAKGGKPIPGAHAVALSLPDSSVVAFAITDKDGHFNITKVPAAPCVVRISCMGYANSFTPVKSLPATDLRIALKAKAFDLAEVAVKTRALGAVVKGDTVKYNVQKYIDGTEQVLGEVLDKLPGVEVDEQGNVKAGGKKVDKLLLNGQDFAGERHDMLTKNLPSDMVDKVELIKNYNEYSQLEGFQNKGTAMNIGVDSAYTRRPTGNAELWGGFRDKYRAKANLFVIGDEVMFGLNAKVYNTGEEAMSLVDYMELCGGVKSFAQAISGRTSAIERPSGSMSAYLSSDETTRRRDDQLVTANVAWNPSQALKINSYIVFNREAAKAREDISRAFLGKDGLPTLLSESSKTDNTIANFNLNLKYVFPHKGILAYRGSVGYSPTDYDFTSDFHGRQEWTETNESFHTEHDLSFAQNFGKRRLLTLRAYAVVDRGTESATLATDSMLLPVAVTLGRVSQDVSNDVDMVGASAAYVNKIGRKLRIKGVVALDYDRVAYRSESDAAELATPKSSAKCTATTMGVFIQKPKGKVQFSAGAQAVHVSAPASRMSWKLLPQAEVEFEFSSLNSLSLYYETEYSRDGSAPFVSSARMSNYRTLSTYARQDEMLHLHQSASFIYMIYDTHADFSCTLHGGAASDANPVERDYRSQEGGGLMVDRVAKGEDDLWLYADLDVQKGLRIPLKFKLKAQCTRMADADLYEGVRYGSVTADASGSLKATTSFRFPLNVEVGGSFGWQSIDMEVADGVSIWRTYSASVQPIFVSRGKGLMIKVPVAYVTDSSADEDIDYVDLGLFASVKVNKHLSVYAEGRDMLHSEGRDRIVTSQSADHIDVSNQSRMPGFVIAGLKFIF